MISIKSSAYNDAALDSVLSSVIGPSTSADTIIQEHPLAHIQASIMALAHGILDVHKPLQATLMSALEHDLSLGQEWSCDGTDAIHLLCKLKEDTGRKIEELLNGSSKSSDSGSTWATAVRKSEKGMREICKTVPRELGRD
jgi:hypothetical protein